MKKILVIGAGSAGLLTLCQLCFLLNEEWEVHSVHDPNIPILGVGESTSTSFPHHLFRATDFIMQRDSDYLDSTYKFNVKYTNWRKKSFDSIIFTGAHAIHFDNTKLKDFVFMRIKEKYPKKFKVTEGNVSYMKNISNGVEVKINDEPQIFDYVIDCSGFPKDFSNYILTDLPLNRALVVRINEPGKWNYTHHWAHKHGWMFGIPLKSKQGWGYMYNDTITSKEDATKDLCDILKLNEQEVNLKDYSFKSYYASDNLIDGRILKNGNKFMFFEPMEALSIEAYCHLNERYVNYINKFITKSELLDITRHQMESLTMFYRFVYHGGSIYNTKFWEVAKKKTSISLKESRMFKDLISWLKESDKDSKDLMWQNFSFSKTIYPFFAYTWEQLDKNLGYGYFDYKKNLVNSNKSTKSIFNYN